MRKQKIKAVFYALLAAVFYALNMPFSKKLLENIPSAMMAGFLYLGAGIGVGVIFGIDRHRGSREELLTAKDLPYTLAMVLLDILAPILLMYGLLHTSSSVASLLNNFEIAATTVIALVLFREKVTGRLWAAIGFVTASSILLSVGDLHSLQFSWGSVFVLLAAVCWGFENNCTRNIASRDPHEIVMIKGLCCGIGSLVIGLLAGEKLPSAAYILPAMLLGFVAYGLSIVFYIRAQKDLGAAKTSAYYAVAPFIGAFLSFVFLKETLTLRYAAALVLMLIGSGIATADTLLLHHQHVHTHVVTHSHGMGTHTHTFTHSHDHNHLLDDSRHGHTHTPEELQEMHEQQTGK